MLRTYHQQGRLLDSGTREQAEASAARAWLADTIDGRHSVLLVDDNAAAARLSGQLRAELVTLGRVAEHGVPLAQGTVAGVGDLVQARWNGWDLAGVEGNRRGPINRETYQVTAVRDDGALDVRLHTGDPDAVGPDGQPIGQPLVLPADYVAEHLALAYASTVHAAQGRTTDTSHAVITSWTSMAALYVALSRGRDANTAHIATTSTIADPAQGRPDQTLHRDPVALLAGILDERDPRRRLLHARARRRVGGADRERADPRRAARRRRLARRRRAHRPLARPTHRRRLPHHRPTRQARRRGRRRVPRPDPAPGRAGRARPPPDPPRRRRRPAAGRARPTPPA